MSTSSGSEPITTNIRSPIVDPVQESSPTENPDQESSPPKDPDYIFNEDLFKEKLNRVILGSRNITGSTKLTVDSIQIPDLSKVAEIFKNKKIGDEYTLQKFDEAKKSGNKIIVSYDFSEEKRDNKYDYQKIKMSGTFENNTIQINEIAEGGTLPESSFMSGGAGNPIEISIGLKFPKAPAPPKKVSEEERLFLEKLENVILSKLKFTYEKYKNKVTETLVVQDVVIEEPAFATIDQYLKDNNIDNEYEILEFGQAEISPTDIRLYEFKYDLKTEQKNELLEYVLDGKYKNGVIRLERAYPNLTLSSQTGGRSPFQEDGQIRFIIGIKKKPIVQQDEESTSAADTQTVSQSENPEEFNEQNFLNKLTEKLKGERTAVREIKKKKLKKTMNVDRLNITDFSRIASFFKDNKIGTNYEILPFGITFIDADGTISLLYKFRNVKKEDSEYDYFEFRLTGFLENNGITTINEFSQDGDGRIRGGADRQKVTLNIGIKVPKPAPSAIQPKPESFLSDEAKYYKNLLVRLGRDTKHIIVSGNKADVLLFMMMLKVKLDAQTNRKGPNGTCNELYKDPLIHLEGRKVAKRLNSYISYYEKAVAGKTDNYSMMVQLILFDLKKLCAYDSKTPRKDDLQYYQVRKIEEKYTKDFGFNTKKKEFLKELTDRFPTNDAAKTSITGADIESAKEDFKKTVESEVGIYKDGLLESIQTKFPESKLEECDRFLKDPLSNTSETIAAKEIQLNSKCNPYLKSLFDLILQDDSMLKDQEENITKLKDKEENITKLKDKEENTTKSSFQRLEALNRAHDVHIAQLKTDHNILDITVNSVQKLNSRIGIVTLLQELQDTLNKEGVTNDEILKKLSPESISWGTKLGYFTAVAAASVPFGIKKLAENTVTPVGKKIVDYLKSLKSLPSLPEQYTAENPMMRPTVNEGPLLKLSTNDNDDKDNYDKVLRKFIELFNNFDKMTKIAWNNLCFLPVYYFNPKSLNGKDIKNLFNPNDEDMKQRIAQFTSCNKPMVAIPFKYGDINVIIMMPKMSNDTTVVEQFYSKEGDDTIQNVVQEFVRKLKSSSMSGGGLKDLFKKTPPKPTEQEESEKHKSNLLCESISLKNDSAVNNLLTQKNEYLKIDNVCDDDGDTPLTKAIIVGRLDYVQKIIEKGADVNKVVVVHNIEDSPLSLAVKDNHVNIAKLLIKNGADVNKVVGKEKESPLHIASRNSNIDIAKLLLENGADQKQKNKNSKTVFEVAKTQEMKKLLQKPPDLNPVEKLTPPKSNVETKDEISENPIISQAPKTRVRTQTSRQQSVVASSSKPPSNPPPIALPPNALPPNPPSNALPPNPPQEPMTLLEAVESGDTNKVKEMLNENADIYEEDDDGNTPISVAIKKRNQQIIDLLLTKGEATYLHRLIFINTDEEIKEYLNKLSDLKILNARMTNRDTPLLLAFRLGKDDVVKLLLEKSGAFDLHKLILDKTVTADKIKKALQDFNPFVAKAYDSQLTSGETPLLLAVRLDKIKIVEMLLDEGADVNKADNTGYTPLITAIQYSDDTKLVDMLLDKDADVNKADNAGYTPLMFAVSNNNEIIVETLLIANADVDRQDNNGGTALIFAAQYKNSNIINQLLNKGAQVKNSDGLSAVDYYDGDDEVKQLLIQKQEEQKKKKEQSDKLNELIPKAMADIGKPQQEQAEQERQAEQKRQADLQAEQKRQADLQAEQKKQADLQAEQKRQADLQAEQKKQAELEAEQKRQAELRAPNPVLRDIRQQLHTINEEKQRQKQIKPDNEQLNKANTLNTGLLEAKLIEPDDQAKAEAEAKAKADKEKKESRIAELNKSLDISMQKYTNEQKLAQEKKQADIDQVNKLISDAKKQQQAQAEAEKQRQAEQKRLADLEAEQQRLANIPVGQLIEPEEEAVLPQIEPDKKADKDEYGTTTPLHTLIVNNGNLTEFLDDPLNIHINLNEQIEGMTPLLLAVNLNKTAAVQQLLKHGANTVIPEDKYGYTPLHIAVSKQNADIIDALLNKNANVNAGDKTGETPLHIAVLMKNSDIVKKLLEKGAIVDVLDRDNRTPLHHAVSTNNSENVKMLLEKGASVKVLDKDGETPLHMASKNKNDDIITQLLDKGAQVNLKDSVGKSVLDYYGDEGPSKDLLMKKEAEENEQLEKQREADKHKQILTNELNDLSTKQENEAKKLKNLEESLTSGIGTLTGAKQNNKPNEFLENSMKNTLLRSAIESNYDTKTVEILLKNVSDVNVRDSSYNTLLHVAVKTQNSEIVKLLLDHGAIVDVTNIIGNTPLHMAVSQKNSEIVNLLLEKGAAVNMPDSYGNTPLHIAVLNNSLELVPILLNAKNTDANVKNAFGKTPLHIAAEINSPEIIKQLLDKGADKTLKNNNGDTPLDIRKNSDPVEKFDENGFITNPNDSDPVKKLLQIDETGFLTNAPIEKDPNEKDQTENLLDFNVPVLLRFQKPIVVTGDSIWFVLNRLIYPTTDLNIVLTKFDEFKELNIIEKKNSVTALINIVSNLQPDLLTPITPDSQNLGPPSDPFTAFDNQNVGLPSGNNPSTDNPLFPKPVQPNSAPSGQLASETQSENKNLDPFANILSFKPNFGTKNSSEKPVDINSIELELLPGDENSNASPPLQNQNIISTAEEASTTEASTAGVEPEKSSTEASSAGVETEKSSTSELSTAESSTAESSTSAPNLRPEVAIQTAKAEEQLHIPPSSIKPPPPPNTEEQQLAEAALQAAEAQRQSELKAEADKQLAEAALQAEEAEKKAAEAEAEVKRQAAETIELQKQIETKKKTAKNREIIRRFTRKLRDTVKTKKAAEAEFERLKIEAENKKQAADAAAAEVERLKAEPIDPENEIKLKELKSLTQQIKNWEKDFKTKNKREATNKDKERVELFEKYNQVKESLSPQNVKPEESLLSKSTIINPPNADRQVSIEPQLPPPPLSVNQPQNPPQPPLPMTEEQLAAKWGSDTIAKMTDLLTFIKKIPGKEYLPDLPGDLDEQEKFKFLPYLQALTSNTEKFKTDTSIYEQLIDATNQFEVTRKKKETEQQKLAEIAAKNNAKIAAEAAANEARSRIENKKKADEAAAEAEQIRIKNEMQKRKEDRFQRKNETAEAKRLQFENKVKAAAVAAAEKSEKGQMGQEEGSSRVETDQGTIDKAIGKDLILKSKTGTDIANDLIANGYLSLDNRPLLEVVKDNNKMQEVKNKLKFVIELKRTIGNALAGKTPLAPEFDQFTIRNLYSVAFNTNNQIQLVPYNTFVDLDARLQTILQTGLTEDDWKSLNANYYISGPDLESLKKLDETPQTIIDSTKESLVHVYELQSKFKVCGNEDLTNMTLKELLTRVLERMKTCCERTDNKLISHEDLSEYYDEKMKTNQDERLARQNEIAAKNLAIEQNKLATNKNKKSEQTEKQKALKAQEDELNEFGNTNKPAKPKAGDDGLDKGSNSGSDSDSDTEENPLVPQPAPQPAPQPVPQPAPQPVAKIFTDEEKENIQNAKKLFTNNYYPTGKPQLFPMLENEANTQYAGYWKSMSNAVNKETPSDDEILTRFNSANFDGYENFKKIILEKVYKINGYEQKLRTGLSKITNFTMLCGVLEQVYKLFRNTNAFTALDTFYVQNLSNATDKNCQRKFDPINESDVTKSETVLFQFISNILSQCLNDDELETINFIVNYQLFEVKLSDTDKAKFSIILKAYKRILFSKQVYKKVEGMFSSKYIEYSYLQFLQDIYASVAKGNNIDNATETVLGMPLFDEKYQLITVTAYNENMVVYAINKFLEKKGGFKRFTRRIIKKPPLKKRNAKTTKKNKLRTSARTRSHSSTS